MRTILGWILGEQSEEILKEKHKQFKEMVATGCELADIIIPVKVRFHKDTPRCQGHKNEQAHIHLAMEDWIVVKATVCIDDSVLYKLNEEQMRDIAFHEITHIIFDSLEDAGYYSLSGNHSKKFTKILNEIKRRYLEVENKNEMRS